jgi:hypothetical protein
MYYALYLVALVACFAAVCYFLLEGSERLHRARATECPDHRQRHFVSSFVHYLLGAGLSIALFILGHLHT